MKLFKLVIFFLFTFICINNNINSQITNLQNAPITTLSSTIACPNTIITMQVTAINVVLTSSLGLELYYDGAVLSYINPNPNHLPGNFHNTNTAMFATGGDFNVTQADYTFSIGLKRIRCWWLSNSSGLGIGAIPSTVNNIASLFELTFRYYGGNSSIVFNNSGYLNGQLCEWADSNGTPYIDTPTEYFYHDGTVTECSIGINNS